MAWNTYKPRGAAKGNEPTSGGAVAQTVPKFAVVKDNIDPLRCGRLRVYVEGMSGLNPDDADSWYTVQYMSPFFGQTLSTSESSGYGTYKTNTHSYGLWAPQPDIGTTVIVLFVNGDPNFGVWIGAVPEPAALQMVPAIGAAIPGVKVVPNEGEANSLGGATRLPAVNVNSNNDGFMSSPKFMFESRPVHSYLAGILFQQGLIRDPLRGVISSSAQRETPSRVMGISTPGRPNYSGGYTDETIAAAATGDTTPPENLKIISRRGGHSLVMDDGDLVGRDQLIRLRTALGHQILMSDDGQCLFIIHSNGKSWIELGKEGTIDMFSTNSVNIRTAGDLNLHADNNINMFAKKSLNLSAESVSIESSKDTTVRTGGNYAQQVVGNYAVKVGGTMSTASSGEGSYYSSATMYINGSIINLNSGQASAVPQNVKPLPVIIHTDTLFDKSKGWLAAPGKLQSIVSRAPAHTPWDPAGSGVSVKVELNADNALPSAPSSAVAAASNAAATQSPVAAAATAATAATVPQNGAVSGAIDAASTSTAVSTLAVAAANGPAAAAAALGGGVTNVAGTAIATVGQVASTAGQLAVAGVIKPGAEVLQTALAGKGLSVEKINASNLFTGVPGAETVQKLANNVSAQVQTVTKNLQNAQAGLTAAGVITGKEAPGSILGTVMAAATNGVQNTVNFVKNAAASAVGAVTGAVTGVINGAVGAVAGAASKVLGGVSAMMNLGNKAGAVAASLGGGLTALTKNITGMAENLGKTAASLFDSAKGAAASAFNAIKASLPTLKAGVPQDVAKIAESAASAAQGGGSSSFDLLSNGVPKLGDAISGVTGAANSINALANNANSVIESARATASGAAGAAVGSLTAFDGAANTAFNAATSSVNQVAGTVQKLGLDASKFVSSSSGIASGLNLIPGAKSAVMSEINNASKSIYSLTNTASSTLKSLSAGVNTGLNSITNSVNSATATIGAATTALQNSTNLLSNGIPKLGADPAAALASTASSALASVESAAGSLKDKIANAGGSLTDLATKGLSTSAVGQLQASIAGLGGGDLKTALPTLAKNTADFGAAADATVASIMGPGISAPNFSGNPATLGESTASKLLEKAAATNASFVAAATDLVKNNTAIANAQAAFNTAATTLIEGSPQIAAAKQTLDQVVGTGIKLQQNASALIKNVNTAVGSIKKLGG